MLTGAQYTIMTEDNGMQFFTPFLSHTAAHTAVVWQGHQDGYEKLFYRSLVDMSLDRVEIVAEGGCHWSPFLAHIADIPLAIWLHAQKGKFAPVTAIKTVGGWSAPQPIDPDFAGNAVALHVAQAGASIWAVWCVAASPLRYTINAAFCSGDDWSPVIQVVADAHVHRPVVAAGATGEAWVAWDSYQDGLFSIWVARVTQDGVVHEKEQVSTVPNGTGLTGPAAWQLSPSITIDRTGAPWISWLCLQDVVRTDGVIDQWPVVRVARRSGKGSWQLLSDNLGSPDLARMAWGLLPLKNDGVWGYLGRRRHPVVLSDPEQGVWLLWERKREHNGRTNLTPGVLCGRHIDAHGTVGDVRELTDAQCGYAPACIEKHDNERWLWYAARVGPAVSIADLYAGAVNISTAPPLVTEDEGSWSDWNPVVLTRGNHGRQQQLPGFQRAGLLALWGDVHVHTGYSADVEGLPDELIYYARDKAGLDFIVLQDNDGHFLFLTESEYRLVDHYSRHFHQDHGFVILPAYEWTEKGPNHRTVIAGRDYLPILRNQSVTDDDKISALAVHAERYGALLHVHHAPFVLTSSYTETNWEVCSGWAVHMLDATYRDKIHHLLSTGRKLGFVGGSDNHRRNPGLGGALTLVYATDFTRAAILAAFRQHRTVATDGSRIGVRLYVNEAFIGDTISAGGAPHIQWEIDIATPATVTLIRDGHAVQQWETDSAKSSGDWVDSTCPPGEHFYYLFVEEPDPEWHHCPTNVAIAYGPRAWTSPIWVTVR